MHTGLMGDYLYVPQILCCVVKSYSLSYDTSTNCERSRDESPETANEFVPIALRWSFAKNLEFLGDHPQEQIGLASCPTNFFSNGRIFTSLEIDVLDCRVIWIQVQLVVNQA